MRAGEVIRWNDFPESRITGTEIKPRWFVFLGCSSKLIDPVFFHLSTTTTQFQYFERNGPRAHHAFCRLKASDTPFEQDCIIDLFEQPYPFTEEVLTGNNDIEFKGELSEAYMRQIYACILKSQHYSPKLIRDIHTAFNDRGITGLKLP